MGRSWSVPVYILDGHFPDAFPAEEDPVPFDGEPHPEHAPVVMGPNLLEPNWENEQQGAATNLGFFGGNPHPHPAQHQPHPVQQHQQAQAGMVGNDDMEVDDADEEMEVDAEPEGGEPWPQLNPAIFVADNVQGNQMQANQVPQHPAVPQDLLDLGLSGSSMRFLRADGPDISIDEVIQLSDDSTSSSDASSTPNEDSLRFAAIQNHCATISLFHRKSLLGRSKAGPSTIVMQLIFIDKALVTEQNSVTEQYADTQIPAPTGLEIVPWRPVLDALALQIWPDAVAARRKAPQQTASPPLIISEDGIVSSTESVPAEFECQTNQIRPSPTTARGRKANQTRQKRKNMSLPEVVSNSDARTPLVQKSVRRSLRLSAGHDGYCPVRIEKEPSKRCRN